MRRDYKVNHPNLPNSPWRVWRSCLKNTGLVIILFFSMLVPPVLGLAIGLRFADAQNREVPQTWSALGVPPERASKILFADPLNLFVETVSGRVYRCCWNPTDAPQPTTTDLYRCQTTPAYQVPTPPGKVMDRREVSYCNAEAVILQTFVILDDGSVWKWRYDPNALAGFTWLVVFGLGGAGFGVIVSASLVKLIIRFFTK